MRKLLSTVMIGLLAQAASAAPYRVVGTIPTVVNTVSPVNRSLDAHEYPSNKIVQLMKIELSEEAKQDLVDKVTALEQPQPRSMSFAASNLPPKLDIGMNNIPVLDQGQHGSCVTFAVSAALDAIIQRGDYISQLCSLELGSTLEAANRNYPSGWNGSDAPIVFSQFTKYGLINRDKQAAGVCSGVTTYNLFDENDEGTPMSIADYQLNSESIPTGVKLDTIVDVSSHLMKPAAAEKAITDIKTSLNAGHRVLIGTMLDVYVDNRDGAVGKLNARNDTWMMTPAIVNDVKKKIIDAAHEMVIIGYDDTAVVTGPNGLQETGVFVLRNSWGTRAGDHGTFYMTYNHFKSLGLDVQAVLQ
jgi:Papain family cysteine protease